MTKTHRPTLPFSTSKRSKAYLAIILNIIIWGAALPIVKPALNYVSPFGFLFFRYLIAAPIMLPVLIISFKNFPLNPKLLLKILLLEILAGPIPLTFLYIGLTKTSAIEASLLGATTPLFVTLGGIIFLKEKEEKREWIGLGIALFGTILLALEPLIIGNHGSATFSLTGNLFILINNLLWSTYLIIAKRVYRDIPKVLISSLSMIVSLFIFSLISLLIGNFHPLSTLTIKEVALASFYMGILGSPIALTLYIYGQNLIEASEASLFSYLSGPIAIPFAMLLLKEVPSSVQLISFTIIFAGVIYGEIKTGKKRSH